MKAPIKGMIIHRAYIYIAHPTEADNNKSRTKKQYYPARVSAGACKIAIYLVNRPAGWVDILLALQALKSEHLRKVARK
jgi:hypothetical protein